MKPKTKPKTKPKKRWKPKFNELYYFVWENGLIDSGLNHSTNIWGTPRIKFGNCFKTRAQAESAAKKVKKLLRSL